MGQGRGDGRGCDWLRVRRFRRPAWSIPEASNTAGGSAGATWTGMNSLLGAIYLDLESWQLTSYDAGDACAPSIHSIPRSVILYTSN